MKSLPSQTVDNILSLLDLGHSLRQVAAQTGLHYSTISRVRSQHRSNLPKALGGRPSKLSPTTARHAQRLISSGKADTAVDVAKNLGEILPEPISTQTIH